MYLGLPNLGLHPSGGGPALSLNFLTESVDPRITYSGGAGGTRVNSAGTIVAATCPRFDYNPSTLASLGLLVEEQRTNLFLRSDDFANAAWSKAGSSITAAASAGPRGAATMSKLVESALNEQHRFRQTETTSAGATVAISFTAKKAERDFLILRVLDAASVGDVGAVWFNLNTGAVGSAAAGGAATLVAGSMQSWGNGVYRCTLIAKPNATMTSAVFDGFVSSADGVDTYLGNGTSGIYIDTAQFEVGAFPTSYIPTVAATVTRTADSAVMTGANFSSWYNQTAGSFAANFDVTTGGTGGVGAFAVGDPSLAFGAAETMYMDYNRSSTNVSFNVLDGGVAQASVVAGAAATTIIKVASAYGTNDFAVSLNGATAATDVAGTVPTPTQMSIGSLTAGWSGASNVLNGHIRSLSYYGRRFPNANLQSLST
jgi:hypothetical protein